MHQSFLAEIQFCCGADEMSAAPGAAQLPAARIKHVVAKHKRSKEPAADDDVDSEEEYPENLHLLDKQQTDWHWVDPFFAQDVDVDVTTWTLVAKELLTVREHLVFWPPQLCLFVSLCGCVAFLQVAAHE